MLEEIRNKDTLTLDTRKSNDKTSSSPIHPNDWSDYLLQWAVHNVSNDSLYLFTLNCLVSEEVLTGFGNE